MMQTAEKITGRICGIKRGAVHDGNGVRTTVFFKGCPLRCVWCHNPESLSLHPEIGYYRDKCIACGACEMVCPTKAIRIENGIPITNRTICIGCFACAEECVTEARRSYGESWDVTALAEILMADKPFFNISGGGVTLSGGECLLQPKFAVRLAHILYREGISVDIDTCGYADRTAFSDILPYVDTFLYDLKAINADVHRCCTGVDNHRILDNLRYLVEQNCRVEIRYPYVPGFNDSECDTIGEYLTSIHFQGKVKVLGYHSFADGKYSALGKKSTLPSVQPTVADVETAVQKLAAFDLVVINGMTDD